ncbi:23S rRNA (adenine(2503)-C(2))-methyltransferase RlmN [Kineococcus sp. R8]|uniref:23S rRNA (adenine(2503)-C(2))-methyltransferase RlmN n=1 Tax=Kineococcus siccus TaxID=2696567 RepID=UPI0014121258|nr:23S rRNA (adenine(2503)-C(2))-methyltransferase RlmN [Kineococcus siccus]NAZ82371.1 23S rRNA (adenine(2503)-C(2))-methyltransferase RlmN [Kineococcus siccus]
MPAVETPSSVPTASTPTPVPGPAAVTAPEGREPLPLAPAGPGQLVMTAPQRGKPPRHFSDLEPAERADALAALGEKPFRARQLATQWFERLEDDTEKMTDLPAASRQRISEALLPTLLTPLRTLSADRGTTVKTLWKLHDGALVESVLMRYPGKGESAGRNTVCISSQAGCGMNCPFCATGQAGLTRNLSTAEIVEQVAGAARALARDEVAGGPGRVTNVVFMGMGEALANYRSAVAALRRLTQPAPDGLGISARGVTMSTVGLVPAMDRFAAEGIPATLALSLHAPDDELRDELVPVNKRWNVAQALDSAKRYFDATGRRVSIEYALIRDVNDQAWRADRLGKLLNARGRGWVHVNPIPLNPTPGSKWTASDPAVERAFVAALEARGVPTTVRDTRGSEIDGACGQLAAAPEEPRG